MDTGNIGNVLEPTGASLQTWYCTYITSDILLGLRSSVGQLP